MSKRRSGSDAQSTLASRNESKDEWKTETFVDEI